MPDLLCDVRAARGPMGVLIAAVAFVVSFPAGRQARGIGASWCRWPPADAASALGVTPRPRGAAGLRCTGAVAAAFGGAATYRVMNRRVEAAIRQASSTRSTEAIKRS